MCLAAIALDAHGNVIEAASPLQLLGVPTLEALVPRQQARTVLSAQWRWRHVVPTRSKPGGHTLHVAGVVAERT